MKKLIMFALFAVISSSSFAFELQECSSFSGVSSKAMLKRLDKNKYNLKYKVGQEKEVSRTVYLNGEASVSGPEDSSYGEYIYTISGRRLDNSLLIRFVLTSNGEDYLYINDRESNKSISSLSCETKN